ncbi:hypothetical protein KMC56_gp14 [Achromobacter phage vB_AxyP_19-32_Axy12]|uniref:Uncharacterized protein n=1 Tax=Achromobacter phage vB_AxyP_19-32_Axy12 TaxID=2591043 RepID=A0A514CUK2_9CAUD|nr:hypothetical protein KMC56_gp14 [Achromobacter phage vB_AxyP_19-32_Axy12]QDH84158.1 hypothetical protein Axy12_014 [Achromobacter phage vB_AxyP_19-32_Axy12]
MLRKIAAVVVAIALTWAVVTFFISLGWAWHIYWEYLK